MALKSPFVKFSKTQKIAITGPLLKISCLTFSGSNLVKDLVLSIKNLWWPALALIQPQFCGKNLLVSIFSAPDTVSPPAAHPLSLVQKEA